LNKVLLAVLAHPDDESFGMGGTLAKYAQSGVDVHLICATRGEVGEMEDRYMEGFDSPAARREHELRCAAGTLGLKSVIFLDYRDSGMPGSPDNQHPRALFAQPVEQVAGDVAKIIRDLKAQVVITFDEIGGYRHPDHISMHNATVKAFEMASDPAFVTPDQEPYKPQKLYFHTMPHTMLRMAVRLMPLFGRNPRQVGKNKDIDLVSIAEVRFPVHARIDYRPVAQVRDEASACHESQGSGGAMLNRPLQALRRTLLSYETFMRAYPPVMPGEPVENDLFAGVKE